MEGRRPRSLPCLLLVLGVQAGVLRGLEIFDPEEVEYVRLNATAVLGSAVTLPCGAATPSIFIWGFTRAGSDANVALAYNYGRGTKMAPHAGLGRLTVPADSPALMIQDVRREAAGTFTCQALDGVGGGARVTFYSTRLHVEDE